MAAGELEIAILVFVGTIPVPNQHVVSELAFNDIVAALRAIRGLEFQYSGLGVIRGVLDGKAVETAVHAGAGNARPDIPGRFRPSQFSSSVIVFLS